MRLTVIWAYRFTHYPLIQNHCYESHSFIIIYQMHMHHFSVTFLVSLPSFHIYPVMHLLNDWKRQKDMERHKNYSVSQGLYHDLESVWGILCLRSCSFLRRKSLCWFIATWKHGLSLLSLWFMSRQLTTVPDKFAAYDNVHAVQILAIWIGTI